MNRSKFYLCLVVGLVYFTTTGFASAQTSSEALIKQLQEQIKILQSQLAELNAKFEATKQEAVVTREELKTTKEEVKELREEIKITRSLRRGVKGDDVRELQEFLSQFPDIYPSGSVTGFFGPSTETAVRKLQQKYGIQSIGIVGPKTISKINELLTEGAGKSGIIPPGLLRAPGIEKKLATTTTSTTTNESILSNTYSSTTPIVATTTITTTIATTTVAVSTTTVSATPTPVVSVVAPAVSTTQPVVTTITTTSTATTTTATTTAITTTATTTATSTTTTTTTASYGSVLNLAGVSDLLIKIWGPGSNGIIMGGGLNYSTQPGVGWSQQYGGIFVTSYSIQGTQSIYLTQTTPSNVTVTGPAGSIIEVWDLENMVVTAKNTTAGCPVIFTAQPNHRYGGFAWYADNSQKSIEINAVYSSSSTTSTCTAATAPFTVSSPNGGEQWTTGGSYTITWTTTGNSASTINFDLYKSGSYNSSWAGNAPNNGSLFWKIPSSFNPGSDYKVRVYNSADPNNFDESNNYFSIVAPGPAAPTNLQTSTNGNISVQPPTLGYYISFNYTLESTTKSFNIYSKKPTDADFVKYTYNAQIPVNPSILPLPTGHTPNFYHRGTTEWQWWVSVQMPSTDLALGEYQFYVTAVDTNDVESLPTQTKSFRIFAAPSILSPANGATTSVSPTITLQPDPAVTGQTISAFLYQQTNSYTGWSKSNALTSFIYDGSALNPTNNPYRLVVYASGGSYVSSNHSVSVFNVSTTTSSFLAPNARKEILASLSQSLNKILQTLAQLKAELSE